MNYELFRTFVLNMKPFISFIITYHNEPEAWLQTCIENIEALGLSSEDVEIIVVDDGSETPPTFAGRSGIHYFRQEQAGLSVARNTGLKRAQGKYIQFVDADDYLIPPAYEVVIEQLKRGDADLVLFHSTTRANEHSLVSGSMPYVPKDYLLHRNLRASACTLAFKREVLGDLCFRPGLLHEDELFTPQLFLRVESVVELKAKAYFYRQHEGTITHSLSIDKVQKRLNDIHSILKELQSLNEPLLNRKLRQLTVDYIQKTWTLTHSIKELRRRKSVLRREGFLPLPLKCYSLRYFLSSLFV